MSDAGTSCVSAPARGEDARVMSLVCHGKRQFPDSIDNRSSPRGPARSPVTAGAVASVLFLESSLRARLTGALEDAASLILILDMEGVVEATERLERDLVLEGALERMGGSSTCTVVLSTGEWLDDAAVRRDVQVDRYEDGPGMEDQSSIL